MIRYLVMAVLSTLVIGCSNPSVVRIKDSEVQKLTVTALYVPRFEGNPAFVEEATDMFVSKLEPQIQAKVIQGSVIRNESTDIISGGNLAPTELALVAAKKSGAQLLILGKVTSHKTGLTLNGFSTIRVINVSNGEIVASFHRPSGLLFAYSEHQCVMEAVSITADDVANVVNKTYPAQY